MLPEFQEFVSDILCNNRLFINQSLKLKDMELILGIGLACLSIAFMVALVVNVIEKMTK